MTTADRPTATPVEPAAASGVERLESLSKIAAVLLAVVYAAGVIVVTLYLASHGSSGLGLLRPQYILAGIWALFPLLGTLFILAAFVVSWQSQPIKTADGRAAVAEPRWRAVYAAAASWSGRISRVFYVTLGWVAIATFFLRFAAKGVDSGTALSLAELLGLGARVFGFSIAIALLAAGTYYLFRIPTGMQGLSVLVLVCSFTAAAVVGYLGFFAGQIYGRIPGALGGGRPTAVDVILKSDTAALSRALQLDPRLVQFPRFKLLFATSETYIIVNPNDTTGTLEIARDLVSVLRTSVN